MYVSGGPPRADRIARIRRARRVTPAEPVDAAARVRSRADQRKRDEADDAPQHEASPRVHAICLLAVQLIAQPAPRGLKADAGMRLRWRETYARACEGEAPRPPVRLDHTA